MLKAEMKKVICTLTFVIFACCMVGTYITQMGPHLVETIEKPVIGQEDYGSKIVEEPTVLMPCAAKSLLCEYLTGYYRTYPYMFYKEVYLKSGDEEKLANILYELTGLSKTDLDSFTDYRPEVFFQAADGSVMKMEAVLPDYSYNESLSYERFKELMEEADRILGGGSSYAFDKLVKNFSKLPMSYEDAIAEYEEVMNGKNLGESYTRLFCDYMGIFLAVLCAFVASFYWSTDKRTKTTELIYSKKCGTCRLVLLRIGGMLLCMLPVITLPYIHMVISANALYKDICIEWGGAVVTMLLWLVPELIFVTVFTALITELVSPYLAIFVQGAWWYMAVSTNELVGDVSKWSLIIRHNTLSDLTVWSNEFGDFVWNRVFYLCLSGVVIFVLLAVYAAKRRGVMNFEFKGFKRNCSKKSKACV